MQKNKNKNKKQKNKEKTKQTNKQTKKKTNKTKKTHELLTYVFKTVAILTIEPTVKSHFKFNISQQIGWRKVSLKIITKKRKNNNKVKNQTCIFWSGQKVCPFLAIRSSVSLIPLIKLVKLGFLFWNLQT